MFYNKMLIRNYYELHGYFDGIENTLLEDYIRKGLIATGKKRFDFLYSQLGYKPIKGYTLKETLDIRKLFATRNYKELKDRYRFSSVNAVKDLFKRNGILLNTFPNEVVAIDDKYKDAIMLLSVYYANDTSIFCNNGKSVVPFFYCLQKEAMSSNTMEKIMDKIFMNKCYESAFVTFKTRKNAKPQIQNKCLVLPYKLTEEEQEFIQMQAIRLATFGYNSNLSTIFKKATNLIFLSITDNKKYLKILDFTRATGITYKEIANNYGVNIPNQLDAFDKYNFLLYNISPDKSYIINHISTDEKPFIEVTSRK